MKLLSWNVNGIRAILKKGFLDFVAKHDPDILCIQEIKARPEQVELAHPSYEAFWNAAVRPGYSGTLTLSKGAPLHVSYGIGAPEHDQEGRVITTEFLKFYLVNVYTPNAGDELQRLAYRQVWDRAFLSYLKTLETKKPIIVCGDLNVAHEEIDLARPKENRGSAGFTDEERAGIRNLLGSGLLDTFREFHKEGGQYTWWTYRAGARERNVGWRIDYFCLSKQLRPLLQDAFIHPEVMGSDHCPVGIIIT